MKNIQFKHGVFLVPLILLGCGSTEVLIEEEKNVGYFVTVFNKSVEYTCENKREEVDESGKFECASFPITFYMDNTRLGEISSIHKDGYVYPQDIILLEESVPVYTSENSMEFLSVK